MPVTRNRRRTFCCHLAGSWERGWRIKQNIIKTIIISPSRVSLSSCNVYWNWPRKTFSITYWHRHGLCLLLCVSWIDCNIRWQSPKYRHRAELPNGKRTRACIHTGGDGKRHRMWKSKKRNRKLNWKSSDQTMSVQRGRMRWNGLREIRNCATENRFSTFTGFVRTRLMTRQILSISHYSDWVRSNLTNLFYCAFSVQPCYR